MSYIRTRHLVAKPTPSVREKAMALRFSVEATGMPWGKLARPPQTEEDEAVCGLAGLRYVQLSLLRFPE